MARFGARVMLLAALVLPSIISVSAAPLAEPLALAAPVPQASQAASSSSYWLESIKRQGLPAFGNDTSYKVYRNVKDYGAKGDGSSDDTDAINKAIADGARCSTGCDSSTTTPAIVYFPSGTYVVSKPIVQLYYTQFIGDATNLPIIKAAATFTGMAVIDADPYLEGGASTYTNQNNFYRQIRNFVIDTTGITGSSGAGIHWQVGQATSLQNIRFEMKKPGDGNEQQGIFMDNGSGGFMTDLTFNGGKYGAFFGNQQFTTRNLTFNDCGTAIYMNWNWLWTLSGVTINNCAVGLDIANSPTNQTVGSVIWLDSVLTNTPIGVNTSFAQSSLPATGGTLIIDNVDFTGSKTAVQDYTGKSILAGGSLVKAWAQGNGLASGAAQARIQGNVNNAPTKPASLTTNNAVFQRAKPQYEGLSVDCFVSLKSAGAAGDGKTDDTDAIQKAIDGLTDGQVLYVDHGAYLITKTITIPAESNVKMTGEIWPVFMATGDAFASQDKPTAVFQVGKASGDKGSFEMSDCIVSTQGPAPGAILMEWNIAESAQGSAGLWDTHFRIGGFAGTQLQSNTCAKNNGTTHDADTKCYGGFMSLHITNSSSGYFENVWSWVADHELDLGDHSQIDIYHGRGLLVESQGPVWLWGTASEHSVLSQYHFQGAKDIFYGAIQTESPYWSPNPSVGSVFKVNSQFFDPDFSTASSNSSSTVPVNSWALRIIDSSSIWGYGSGTYSFFNNYGQECLATESCQQDIIQIDGSTDVNLFGISTKASVNMITQNGKGVAVDADNRSNFCATIAIFAQA